MLGVIIWSIGALFFLYEFFLRTFLVALANQIIPDLHLSPSQFSILAAVFYIAYGLMQVPVGALVDRFGVKVCISLAAIICGVGALWFSQAHTFFEALSARFLMGLGGGFAFMCLLIITMQWFPEKYLALFVGLGQFIGTMGALCAGGPLATVVVSHHVPWRFIFEIIAGVGVLLASLSVLFIKRKQKAEQQKAVIIGPEKTAKDKLFGLAQSPQAWWVAVYSAFVFLSAAMLGAVWGTAYLQSLGYNQALAASIVSFSWLGFAIGCPLLGALSDLLSRRKSVMVLCALIGLLACLGIVYAPISVAWCYMLLFFLLGFCSAGQSIGFAIITEHVPPESKSVALGLNSAFITLLAAVLPVFIGLVIEHVAKVPSGDLAHYAHHDFVVAFICLPCLYVGAFLICFFFIDETYCRSQKEVVYLDVSSSA